MRAGRFTLALTRPLIMGIVNVTPDSFSDGGRFLDPQAAIDHGRRLADEGADILDVGGESTRPGAVAVDAAEELRRVLPVVEALARGPVPVSVDTSKPEVMRAAIGAGASMINDVYACRMPGALEAAQAGGVAVCLMHMQGEPRTMQIDPRYDDVVAEVVQFLDMRADAAMRAGIPRDRLVLDPGFGFGKSPAHNLALIRALPRVCALGYPVLVGLSRKSLLGRIVRRTSGERVHASVAAALAAVARGASIVRVHDVAATHDALSVWHAIQDEGYRFDDQ